MHTAPIAPCVGRPTEEPVCPPNEEPCACGESGDVECDGHKHPTGKGHTEHGQGHGLGHEKDGEGSSCCCGSDGTDD